MAKLLPTLALIAGLATPAAAQEAMADMPGMAHGPMTGALGAYPMSREASGTSWQPDASEHQGLHILRGDWTVMVHATLNGVYDWQQGPRGDSKTFVSGMVMGMAQRSFAGGDTWQVRAMLSPDALMGANGYPLLLASGETANGVTPLIDRQHPHDLFMELATSYSHRLGPHDSVFVYAGLPGEPAFGPPAFMHRASIMDSPEAPISHHWLDSTHISMGVVTGGYIHDDWKVEVSRFRGREPDEHRYDIETPKLDSTALRLSFNPTRQWALQVSWADQVSPEELAPAENIRRWSASAIYTRPVGEVGWWSTTAAWGRRTSEYGELDAYALESAVKTDHGWTLFSRAEQVKTDELIAAPVTVATVRKVSLGAVRDWPIAAHLSFGVGGLYAWNFVPAGLASAYGGEDPKGAMGFVRLKLR